jgi:DNA-binding NarL/FixJ family response regulator
MTPIRVLIVDDSIEFTQAAKRYLAQLDQVSQVQAVQDASSALVEMGISRPDLLLVDLSLRGMDGIQVTYLIKKSGAAVRVLIVTVEDNPEHRQAALAAGADGFMSKSELVSWFLPTIRELFGEDVSSSSST